MGAFAPAKLLIKTNEVTMKLNDTRPLLAAAIAAGLLAGCSHNDATVKSDTAATPQSQAQATTPFNPQNVDRSKIPPQFQEQFLDPSKVNYGTKSQTKQ